MTRVVVHIGAQRTGSEVIHRGLYANQDVLAEHGVLLPDAGRHDMSPRAVRHHPLAWSLNPGLAPPHDSEAWGALAHEIEHSTASTALLSSELFAPLAANPSLAPLMLERLQALSDDVTLVFFVREQLGLLNSLYCNRVKGFEVTSDFGTYLAQSPDVPLYDLSAFRFWYDDPPVRFVSVPWDPDGGADPFAALLAAADIAVRPDELREPDETYGEELGPIGIEATRLLGTFLRGRFPDFDPNEQASRRLRRHASTMALAQGWCDEAFWGWSPNQADRMVARYAESNQEFARRNWDADWALPAPLARPQNVVELVELNPGTVQRVNRFVSKMEQHFLRLRAKQDKT